MDHQTRSHDFVHALWSHYRAYHDHKESMAYAGAALYIATFGTGLVSSAWPPFWGYAATVPLALIAIVLAWAIFNGFIRFQLRNRRWAALRIAGCEAVLAYWLLHPPSENDLAFGDAPVAPPHARFFTLLDFLWPIRRGVPVLEPALPAYPRQLVDAWVAAQAKGTHAIVHERLIAAVSWGLLLALLWRTAVHTWSAAA
jgi:hypothetical protein